MSRRNTGICARRSRPRARTRARTRRRSRRTCALGLRAGFGSRGLRRVRRGRGRISWTMGKLLIRLRIRLRVIYRWMMHARSRGFVLMGRRLRGRRSIQCAVRAMEPATAVARVAARCGGVMMACATRMGRSLASIKIQLDDERLPSFASLRGFLWLTGTLIEPSHENPCVDCVCCFSHVLQGRGNIFGLLGKS